MKIYHFVLLVIVLATIFILFLMATNNGLSGYEKYECERWQAEAKTYKGYFLTGWQKAQCDHYRVQIEAPVQ